MINEKAKYFLDKNNPKTEYDFKVMQGGIKEQFGLDMSIDEIKEYYSNKNEVKKTEIDIINDIVDNDNNIPKSDWEQFKDWKNNDAVWNLDKDGAKTSLADCFENIVGFIENYPKTKNKIKFNKIRNIIELDGRQILDSDYHTIMNYICKYFIPKFSKLKMIKDACDNVGFKHQYNRWVDYFNDLKYEDDGIDYIDYTIKNVLCCEEQEKYYDLYYETLKIMYLATMSRIYNKELKGIPTKYDIVVTFCGKNGGSGKTTYLDRLYDIDNNDNSYCYICSGDAFKPSDKDFIERTHQCVCLLIDEISMKRNIITSVKGYITQKEDKFRKSFGFNNESHKRGFIITASSNNDDILKDYTTNNERRWAIIKISENVNNHKNVNKAFDSGYRDKLWAFVKNIYENEEFNLYFTDERIIKLEEDIQRDYKASNNDDYSSIIDDLLEREYGFVDINGGEELDVDYIINQYLYGDSKEWCKKHNEEYEEKVAKSLRDEYIMKPEDRKITTFGKINIIQKTKLYKILNKLNIDYTKPSLRAELEYSGKWDGYLKGKDSVKFHGRSIRAYWRKENSSHIKFDNNDSIDTILPF
jgi:predicted P-loop ATPase